MKKILTILFILGICFHTHAQELTITNYTNKNDQKALAQEGNFLWTAAPGGVLQWNLTDLSYTEMTTADGLVSNLVFTVFIDENQNKWFGTDKGIQILNTDGSWSYLTTDDGLPYNEVTKINIDDAGNRWFAHQYSGASVWRTDGSWQQFGIADGLADTRVNAIYFDIDGNTWLGTGWEGGGGSIAKITPSGDMTIYGEADGLHTGITDIGQDLDGTMWFTAMYDGIISLSPDGIWTFYGIADGIELPRYGAVAFDNAGNRYFGQSIPNAGIGSLLRINNLDEITYFNNLSNMSAVTDMLLTSDTDLWMTTLIAGNVHNSKGGLVKFDTNTETYTNYKQQNTVSDNDITHIFADDNGTAFISSRRGLSIKDAADNWTYYDVLNGLHGNNITHTFTDASGNIWIGLDGGSGNAGLNKIAPDGTITSYTTINSDLFSDRAEAMYVDSEGKVWLGAQYCGGCFWDPEGGISVLDTDGNWTIYRVSDGLIDQDVRFLTEDADGRIWALTDAGISIIEDGEFTNYPGTFNMRQLAFDSEGTAWIVTGNDPWLSPEGAILSFTETGGFTTHPNPTENDSYSYSCIVIDQHDNKWMGTTSYGIIKMDSEGNFTQLTTADGLAANQIHDLALGSNNQLWAGTLIGVSVIDADEATGVYTPALDNATLTATVYPNPFTTYATVKLNQVINGQFRMYDLAGKLINQQNLPTNQPTFTIENQGFSPGIYLYEIFGTKGELITGKLVIE